MRERPDSFLFNPQATLAEGLMFAGLAGDGCVGSVDYSDSSLFGNRGTLTNMDPSTAWQWSAELGRWVLDFTNSSNWVRIAAAGRLQLPFPLSLSCWVSHRTLNTLVGPLSTDSYRGSQDNAYSGAVIGRWSDNKAFVGFGNGSDSTTAGQRYNVFSAGALAASRWYHLCGVLRAARDILIYVDGKDVSDSTSGTTSVMGYRNADGEIGSVMAQSADGASLDGLIADPLIHNRALTPSEIQALADPSNTMLSVGGSPLLLPPRRKLFVGWSAAAPLSLTGAAINLPSPYTNGDPVDTAVATGGSAPIAYSVVSQSSDVEVLKVTGTLTPDATGYSVAAGTHNGEPYYSWEADGTTWYNWLTSTDPVRWELSDVAPGGGFDPGVNAGWERYDNSRLGEYVPINTTGTATVALAAPFAVNSSTGAITVADAGALVVGHTWTLVVRATDDLLDTADGTWTITMVAGVTAIPAIVQGVGSLTAASFVDNFSNATAQGTGSLVAGSQSIREASAAIQGVGSLTAGSQSIRVASAIVQGVGNLVATSQSVRVASATLSSIGQLTVVSNAASRSYAIIQGIGSITAIGRIDNFSSAIIQGTGSLTAGSQSIRLTRATLSSIGSLVAVSQSVRVASATLSSIGQLSATGFSLAASANLTSIGQLGAVSYVDYYSYSTLYGEGQLTGVSVIAYYGVAELSSVGRLLATSVSPARASCTLTGTGSLYARSMSATRVHNIFGSSIFNTPVIGVSNVISG